MDGAGDGFVNDPSFAELIEVPTVVHVRDRIGYDVYIGRPSKWGNPFHIGRGGDRSAVIAKYRTWIRQQPQLLAALEELRGKALGCYCAPSPCHGDVLVDLVCERLAHKR